MKMNRGVGHFARNRSGNAAVIFALCLFPLLAVVGFAIDFSYRQSAQAHVQSALDMSGLAAMRTYSQDSTISEAELQEIARIYFASETEGRGSATLEEVVLTRSGRTATLTVEGTVPTSIVHLLGHDTLPIGTTTEVTFGDAQKVEIALVLDMSGSMNRRVRSGTRLDALQSSAKKLITELIDSGRDQFKMSIVPFSTHINVGTAHRNKFWMNVDPDRMKTYPGRCTPDAKWARANCPKRTWECGSEGKSRTCSTHVCNGIRVPKEFQKCTKNASALLSWHGCVYSRPPPYNKNDTTYNSNKVHGFVSEDSGACAAPIQEMTNNATALNASIDALKSYGETYIPAGLIWGWRTLSAGAPFTEGEPIADFVADGNIKILILMSDGENSVSATSIGEHEGKDLKAADNLTIEVCRAIKAKRVQIVTIAFGVTDIPTKEMLKKCASSATSFYEADDADELTEAFLAIRDQLERSLAISG